MSRSETESEARLKFLGTPPLTRTDNKDDYNALHKQVESHVKPQDFFEDLRVRDITDAIWEGQRYKRYQTKLIESAFHAALVQALTQINCGDDLTGRIQAAKFYSDNVEERRAVLNLLEQFGVSIEMLHAMATSLNAEPITVLERMISNRRSSRSQLLKDHDRHLIRSGAAIEV